MHMAARSKRPEENEEKSMTLSAAMTVEADFVFNFCLKSHEPTTILDTERLTRYIYRSARACTYKCTYGLASIVPFQLNSLLVTFVCVWGGGGPIHLADACHVTI